MYECVCLCVKVEPAGPGHCAAVSDGHHPGGDRDQCCPAHQPHYHQDHESTEDSSRYARYTCEIGTHTHSLTSPIAPLLPLNAFSELEY